MSSTLIITMFSVLECCPRVPPDTRESYEQCLPCSHGLLRKTIPAVFFKASLYHFGEQVVVIITCNQLFNCWSLF